MARIQILPLPTIKMDGYEQTPFILILDQTDRRSEDWPQEMLEALKRDTGAVTVLAHETTIDAPGALKLTDEQRDQLLAYITQPQRIVLGEDIPADAVTDHGRVWLLPDPLWENVKPIDVDELPDADQWQTQRYEQRYTQRPRITGTLYGTHPHLGHVRHEPTEDGTPRTVTDVEIHLDHDGHGIVT